MKWLILSSLFLSLAPSFAGSLEALESAYRAAGDNFLKSPSAQREYEKALSEYTQGTVQQCDGPALTKKLSQATKAYPKLAERILKAKPGAALAVTVEGGFTFKKVLRPWHAANLWGQVEGCGPRACNSKDKLLRDPWSPAIEGALSYVVEKANHFTGASVLLVPARAQNTLYTLLFTYDPKGALTPSLIEAFTAEVPSKSPMLTVSQDGPNFKATGNGQTLNLTEFKLADPESSRQLLALGRNCESDEKEKEAAQLAADKNLAGAVGNTIQGKLAGNGVQMPDGKVVKFDTDPKTGLPTGDFAKVIKENKADLKQALEKSLQNPQASQQTKDQLNAALDYVNKGGQGSFKGKNFGFEKLPDEKENVPLVIPSSGSRVPASAAHAIASPKDAFASVEPKGLGAAINSISPSDVGSSSSKSPEKNLVSPSPNSNLLEQPGGPRSGNQPNPLPPIAADDVELRKRLAEANDQIGKKSRVDLPSFERVAEALTKAKDAAIRKDAVKEMAKLFFKNEDPTSSYLALKKLEKEDRSLAAEVRNQIENHPCDYCDGPKCAYCRNARVEGERRQ